MKKRVNVMIFGKVQGVFFRDNIMKLANTFSIKGWVKNINSEVEAVFEGDQEKIERMLEFCRKGPEEAFITNLDVKEENYTGEFKDFKIIYPKE